MKSISVLDVTLRDGGCVNDFNFQKNYIEMVIEGELNAGVDIIEVGYIDGEFGSEDNRTKFINEKVIKPYLIKEQRKQKYVAMIDLGKYNLENLEQRVENGIDGIRLAFHKKDWKDSIKAARKILDKNYEVFIQPMLTMRYSDEELLDLISAVNMELADASAFYIVDSFGEMRENDLYRKLNFINDNLIKSMPIGLHSHNNLQMSYSNAIYMLQLPMNRDAIIDSSIMGMGKGAGNLNTELLLEHLNLFYGKEYCIEPLLDVMDKVINQIHSEFYWGYAPEYYLSSINHCSPSYASFYYDRHMLSISQVSDLLSNISEDKRISFDKEYAELLYRAYNERQSIDDSKVIDELCSKLNGKEVILIAPGKSVISKKEVIEQLVNDNSKIVIGLNFFENFEFDYTLITREELFFKAIRSRINILVTSNISKEERENVRVLDYEKWINIDKETHDSSTDIIFNLLDICNVNSISLIGFDGFSININNNYYNLELRHPVNAFQAESRNLYFKNLINLERKKGKQITFITDSLYM